MLDGLTPEQIAILAILLGLAIFLAGMGIGSCLDESSSNKARKKYLARREQRDTR